MIFRWLGWVTFGVCIILLAKFIGRVSKSKNFNLLLRKTHIPFGIAAIVLGAVHGLFFLIEHPQKIAGNSTGIVLWALTCFLALTYVLRKKLKAKWFFLHRLLSVLFILLLIVHIVVVFAGGEHGTRKRRGRQDAAVSGITSVLPDDGIEESLLQIRR